MNSIPRYEILVNDSYRYGATIETELAEHGDWCQWSAVEAELTQLRNENAVLNARFQRGIEREGYDIGWREGWANGFDAGNEEGHQVGYNLGLEVGRSLVPNSFDGGEDE